MPFEFEAIYEDGVLKPMTPLPLEEHQRVRLCIQCCTSISRSTYGIIGWQGDPKVVEEIALGPEFSGLGTP